VIGTPIIEGVREILFKCKRVGNLADTVFGANKGQRPDELPDSLKWETRQMKAISRLITLADWSITLLMGYFLLQFGADRVSRLVSSKYVTGNYSEVDWWLTTLGIGALVSIFFLIHPRSRFYAATALAVMLGGDSLKSLSLGDPQAVVVPLMSLAAASLVLLSRKPSKMIYRLEVEEPSLTEVNLFEYRA
jgi:hypothetical protein